jgi:Ca2+-binding RTX toxin-like protein
MTLLSPPQVSNTSYTVGTAATVTGTITNDDFTNLPAITLALNSTTVTENGSLNFLYTFTRSGDTSSPLAVNFSVGGTAVNITDYKYKGASSFNGTSGTITFAAGSSKAILTIDPLGDTTFITEPDKTVEIAIASGTGYAINTANPLTGTILNDDGDNGDNVLNGTSGRDILNGGAGNDTMTGFIGNDTYYVDSIGDVINENVNEGTDTVITLLTTDLNGTNLENITLLGLDNLDATGNSSANTLIGNSGNNTLTGNGGNDNLNGGLGDDTLIGGTENDIYTVDAGDTFTENVGEGIDTLKAPFSYDLNGSNFENLTLIGTGNLNGTGDNGNNNLIGNSKNNTLTGNGGNDTLTGGSGNDILVGGNGNDSLTGSAGLDQFVFNTLSEGLDTINDFKVIDDTIVVSAGGFGGSLVDGAEISSAQLIIGSSATNAAHRFIYTSTTGALSFDVDGSGGTAATQFATLKTNLLLTNTDIFVTV